MLEEKSSETVKVIECYIALVVNFPLGLHPKSHRELRITSGVQKAPPSAA